MEISTWIASGALLVAVIAAGIAIAAHRRIKKIKRVDLRMKLDLLQNQLRSDLKSLSAEHGVAWRDREVALAATEQVGGTLADDEKREWDADGVLLSDETSGFNVLLRGALKPSKQSKDPQDLADTIVAADDCVRTIKRMRAKYSGWRRENDRVLDMLRN